MNIGRILTLHKPYSAGKLEMYMTVKNLAFNKSKILKLIGYQNTLVDNTRTALFESEQLLLPFRKAIKKANRHGFMPALVHMDFDDMMDGCYDWAAVKELLNKELDWMDVPKEAKGLHTSCKIERCK